jgi:hypothetical protein
MDIKTQVNRFSEREAQRTNIFIEEGFRLMDRFLKETP